MKTLYLEIITGLVIAGYAVYAIYRIRTARRCPACKSVRLWEFDHDVFGCNACGNVFADDAIQEDMRQVMVEADEDHDIDSMGGAA